MDKVWSDTAWEDYLYWQTQDKKTLKRINALILDVDRNRYSGIGKPEPLKGSWSGFWSRRIDEQNRLVYRIRNNTIEIAQCRTHYADKQLFFASCLADLGRNQRLFAAPATSCQCPWLPAP